VDAPDEEAAPVSATARRRGTLTWRIVAILAAAAVVPTVIVGVLAVRRARSDVEREVVRGNLALVRAVGAQLDGTLQDARRSLELAAASWADGGADPKQTDRLLGRLRRQVPILSALTIVDPDGARVAGDPLPAGVDTGANSFGGYIGDVRRSDDRSVVEVVVQARSRTGELVGVFVAALDLGFVADALAAVRLGRGALLYLVDGHGIPVARSDGAPPGADSWRGRPAVDRALGAAVEGHLSAHGTVAVFRSLASYQTMRGVRWALVLEQPEKDAYALAAETRTDTLIAGTVALALALLIGSLLAARLTRPLTALADRADAIASGNTPPRAPVDGPGEVGELSQRIEEMARRIAERAELQAALARGDRLATVGVMSASVAHEINNPLTTVLGYARLLAEDKAEDHPDRAGLELIASEADRMKVIVSGLLDYARVEKQDRGPTELAGVLRHVSALMEPQLRRAKVRLALDAPADLPPVAADAHALQQVLVNLVQNAAQAMQPAGGAVTARASSGPGGLTVICDILDEGPGVPAEARARVFDPFYTTKDAGIGTGLGLAVCKHLVATFGGTIDVGEGDGGRGARFRVVIPKA
jgi:two-component system NtrC family sensor kinase